MHGWAPACARLGDQTNHAPALALALIFKSVEHIWALEVVDGLGHHCFMLNFVITARYT
jgi:hypothetical protein